jgi:hypothetical protein
VSRSLLEVAMASSNGLRILIAKIICYSLVIFSLVAAFEALVINGIRLCCNAVLLFINTGSAPSFSNTGQKIVEVSPNPPVSIEDGLCPERPVFCGPDKQTQITDDSLPHFLPHEEKTFSKVFEILATSGYSLPFHTPFLIKSDNEMRHIHPLQVMGYMLQKNSKQKQHCAIFFKKAMVRNFFINSTLKGFQRPAHVAKTAYYIASFAEKVDVDPDMVRRLLFQQPPLLQDLVLHILQR